MSPKAKVYIEACPFIDMAKEKIGRLPSGREDDVWFCKKLLEASRNGDIQVMTASLTISECQHADGVIDERVQTLFKGMLTSGQYVVLVQDSPLVAERARDLRWVHDIRLGGADAHHVASALEAGCKEFITTDGKIYDNREKLRELGLRVIRANETEALPSEYRQGSLLDFQSSEDRGTIQ